MSEKKIPKHYKKTGNTKKSISEQAILRWLKKRPSMLKSGLQKEVDDTCDNCFKHTGTKVKLIKWLDEMSAGTISCPVCHRVVSEPDAIKFNKYNQKINVNLLKNVKLKKLRKKPEISESKKLIAGSSLAGLRP